jgi:hypothetical protein
MPNLTDIILAEAGIKKEPEENLWERTLGRGFGRTVEEVGDFIEGDPSKQSFLERIARKGVADVGFRPVQYAIEGVGGAIGGAAGGVGALTTDFGSARDIWEGVKAGAQEGVGQAKDVVENIDVLSLGAGGGASVLTKAAGATKAATTAASTLRAAKVANIADVGLSAADATYGAATLADAVREGDLGKGFEGLARVAGNVLGLKFAKGDWDRIAQMEPVIAKYKRFEEMPSAEAFSDVIQEVSDTTNLLRKQVPESEESLEAISREWSTPEFLGETRPKVSIWEINQDLATYGNIKATKVMKSSAGNEFHVLRKGERDDFWGPYEDSLMRDFIEDSDNAKTLNWFAETADNIARRAGVDVAQKMRYGGKVDPMDVQAGVGRFGGWEIDPTQTRGGWTISRGGRKMTNVGQGNAYYINIPATYRAAGRQFKEMIKPTSAQYADEILDILPPHLHEAMRGFWSGQKPSVSDFRQIRNAMFMRTMVYNMLHESVGHALRGTGHTISGFKMGAPTYLTKGIVADKFDAIHNIIVDTMKNPEVMAPVNAVLLDPHHISPGSRIDKLVDAINPQHPERVKFRTDRPLGPTKNTKPEILHVDDLDEGAKARGAEIEATPEMQGPQIETALHDRIKAGLNKQIMGRRAHDIKVAETRAAQFAELDALGKELAEGRIDIESFRKQQEEILKQATVKDPNAAVAMTREELDEIWREIVAKDIGDDFASETPAKVRLERAVEKLHKGEQLQQAEIRDLQKYFMAGRTGPEADVLWKSWRALRDTVGLSRAIMTSWDVSAAGRQGLFAAVTNPKLAGEAMMDQFKAFVGTEDQFKTFMQKLESPRHNPYYDLQKASDLHFSHQYAPGKEAKAEEFFQYSRLAENVPLVRRSERAYIAFLNKMRVGLFNKMADKMLASAADGGLGMNVVDNLQEFKDLAYMVNTLTGRGELSIAHISPASFSGKKLKLTESFTPGKEVMDKAHEFLTAGLFAPRFMASRAAVLRDASMALVGGNLSPVVYKEYMRNVLGTTITIATAMSALAAMGLGKLNWDTDHSDFGVLKIGNARYDPWGGMKQWVKLFAMLGSDDYITSTNRRRSFGTFGARDKKDLLTQFMLTKGSPAVSLLMEAITGENVVGRKRPYWKAVGERFMPMVLQNMYEIYEEEGAEQAALSLPFVAVGGNITAYDPFRRD